MSKFSRRPHLSSALYSAAGLLGSCLALPAFYASRRGRRRIWERYGNWGTLTGSVFWFHGASAGEVQGLIPLIKAVRQSNRAAKILVSVTSPSGLERAAPFADFVRLLPFDHPLWIRRALKNIECKAFIFGETELWPALLAELDRRNVPLFLVNGRLSEFSLKHYRLMGAWLRRTLSRLSLVCAANRKYQARFIDFGVDPARVLVTGNAKYDSAPSITSSQALLEQKRLFFNDDLPVLTLGSLRPGEEVIWFAALAAARKRGLCFNTVVAPRHLEKCDYFISRLNSCGLPHRHASAAPGHEAIVLLDSFGALETVYSFSDLAFIGGSLVPGFGGHNPLEAAAYGVCLALGPYCENIDDIKEQLQDKEAFTPIATQQDAEALLEKMSRRDPSLRTQGSRAREVWQENFGAGDRIMQAISKVLESKRDS